MVVDETPQQGWEGLGPFGHLSLVHQQIVLILVVLGVQEVGDCVFKMGLCVGELHAKFLSAKRTGLVTNSIFLCWLCVISFLFSRRANQ